MVTPEEQALLICARPKLGADLSGRLRALLGSNLDCRTVIHAAVQNLIVPLVAQHVIGVGRDYLSDDDRALIIAARNQAIIRMMHIVSLKRGIIENHLAAQNVSYVELKGNSISFDLYGEPFLRQYRDIDLLVDEHRIFEVASQLIIEGWSVINKEWNPEGGRTLDVLSKFQAAIELRHQSGVVLELHRTIDNSGCVFNSRELLNGSILTGKQAKLPLAQHIAYLCFHHSRHQWESLHWCGDAAAIAAMPSVLLNQARAFAKRHGFESTIDETLKLADNLEEIAIHGALRGESIKSLFLDDCLMALRRSVAPSVDGSTAVGLGDERQPDFAYAWQRSRTYELKFAISRFRPTLNDHDWFSFGPNWRWMYWVTRPARLFWKFYRRRVSKSIQSS